MQTNLLQEAQRAGYQSILDYFYQLALNHYTVAATDKFNNTLLHWAMHTRQSLRIVKSIAKDSIVNQANRHGETPLILAIANDSEEVVTELLGSKAILPNQINFLRFKNELTSPLIYAIKWAHNKALKVLLADKRIDINFHKADFLPPLVVAADCQNQVAITELLKLGAKIDADNYLNVLPQDYTRDRRIENQLRLMHYLEQPRRTTNGNSATLTVLGQRFSVPRDDFAFLDTLCQVVFEQQDPAQLDDYQQIQTKTFRMIYQDPTDHYSEHFTSFNITNFNHLLKNSGSRAINIIIQKLDKTGMQALISALKNEPFRPGISIKINAYEEISEFDERQLVAAVKENTLITDFTLPDPNSALQADIDVHCAKNRDKHNYLNDNKRRIYAQIKSALANLQEKINQIRLANQQDIIAIKPTSIHYYEYANGSVPVPHIKVWYAVTDFGRNNSFSLKLSDCVDEATTQSMLDKEIRNIEKAIEIDLKQPGYLKQHKKEILNAALKIFISAMMDVREYDYGIMDGKVCILIQVSYNGKLHNFSYSEDDCTDPDKFLDDILTDVGINVMDANYGINKQVMKFGEIPFNTSIYNDAFQGHAGLKDFWDVSTLTFNWSRFAQFLQRVNAPYTEKTNQAGVATAGLFAATQPKLKTSDEVVPIPRLVNVAGELRKSLPRPEAVVIQRLGS